MRLGTSMVDKGRMWGFLSGHALEVILVGFTLFGLASKLAISLNRDLDSDTVIAGIMTMEFWRRSNYLFQDFYVPANCSHLFTEVLPFYLIPGILSDFSPVVYRLVPFALFILIILTFAYIILVMTGSRVKALAFSALVASMSPLPFSKFFEPMMHNGVLFFTGLLILLLLSRRFGYYSKLALFTVILSLLVLSDTMIVIWFFIPLVAYYILFYPKKDFRSNLSMALICSTSVIVLAAKMLLVDYYVIASSRILPLATIINVNIPLYLNGILMLYNGGLYQCVNGLSKAGILDIAFVAVTVLLICLVYKYYPRKIDGKMLMVYSIFFFSTAIMMVAYVISDYGQGIETTRYLIFTGLLIFLVVAVSFNEKSRLFAFSLIALLALLALSNVLYVNTFDGQPNKEQYGLISYLQANGLYYGYGDYWTANVVTYLSDENVSIRQINFDENVKLNDTSKIIPYMWESNMSWYTYQPGEYFIIIEKNQSSQAEFVAGYLETHVADRRLEYDGYEIYVFHARPDILIREPRSHISLVMLKIDNALHGSSGNISMY